METKHTLMRELTEKVAWLSAERARIQQNCEDLVVAIENIIWKLDRNESADGTTEGVYAAMINRSDVVIREARAALAKAGQI